MRAPGRSRGIRAAVLAIAVLGGAAAAVLGGCGRSGPLYLPEESSLVWNETVPGLTAARAGAPAIPPRGIARRPHPRSPLG